MVKEPTPLADGDQIWAMNRGGRMMKKTNGPSTEGTNGTGNSGDSRPAIAASERALNGAILAAEISESYEEYLEIFDQFYADDIHATADGLNEPVEGKAAVRARLAGFLVPLHMFAEIGGLSVSIRWSPITGDRPDETNSAWTVELRGVTGASCTVTWCSRRRWRAGRVLSEHHYDHHQIGGPLTFSDLRLSGGETAGNVSTRLAKPQ
jgi:hypothetical protein